ncbi:glutamyl-tRNA reductase [Fulvivirga sedimenti]|uniref:Glutamyl-tRNA reductase n=1 Tax=Fulvivirga sedimenti TaxID=2879465 RepID=A0A9X1HRP4_9BACT|nr:glutamyl-tRNA reductase [Fulvivirga sedimenti]MCA6075539.1 glutamyl-tRNA reductase [Fulvivirga sedimenti]MCA6076716.1 glutamyl-tRNA reductase [Fulvivirga sedimenti]MCA6077844.1 glutamyl-tRNA reductase [Fulvivirga sedimenti]
MSVHFNVIGLSFKGTPIEIREQLALDESEVQRLLQFLSDFTSVQEALVLSTCNRTEVFFSSEDGQANDIIKGIATIKGLSFEDIVKFFQHKADHEASIEYLFRVSMGLEAQVIGDIQISNQVKRAYQQSADVNLAGPFLHRLMHTIFFTNKRVVQETAFRDGAASVSYAAKELAEDVTREIIDPRVLILGLGEIGLDVCRNLVDSKLKDITIVNRTFAKSEEMAAECGFKTGKFEDLMYHIDHSDIIISSVSSHEPLITRKMVANLEILTPKFFIDLSVPRSIDLHAEEVPGVLVYNIDHIQEKTSEALQKRIDSIESVERIIDESIAEFRDWSKEMIVSPTIKKLKNALEEIRQSEMEKYLRTATPEQVEIIDRATKSMVQKIMKYPVLQLKAACQRGDAENLIDILNDLFDLEKQSANTNN